MPDSSETILQEAQRIVMNGDRQHVYGHPREDFAKIALLWNGWIEAKIGINELFQPQDIADLMILLKMARLMNTPDHRDSHVDIAGYAETRARVMGVDA